MQIELLIDAVQTARGQLTLSIPELDSEQTFQTHFNPGKTKSNFTILINTVLEMTPVSLLCVISITRPRSCFIFFLHSGQSGETMVAKWTWRTTVLPSHYQRISG